MSVVIFRARIREFDPRYAAMAEQPRACALTEFSCQEFTTVIEGEHEIALSCWRSLGDICRWHADAEHQVAQALGRDAWYADDHVDVADILRRYPTSTA